MVSHPPPPSPPPNGLSGEGIRFILLLLFRRKVGSIGSTSPPQKLKKLDSVVASGKKSSSYLSVATIIPDLITTLVRRGPHTHSLLPPKKRQDGWLLLPNRRCFFACYIADRSKRLCFSEVPVFFFLSPKTKNSSTQPKPTIASLRSKSHPVP